MRTPDGHRVANHAKVLLVCRDLGRTETAVLPTLWGSTAGVGAAAEAGVLLRTTRGEGGGLVTVATISYAWVMVLLTKAARCAPVMAVMLTVEGTSPVAFVLG